MFFQAVYDRLFSWVVQKINESITVEQTSRYNKGTVIGVLDIYGFEIFGTNRWASYPVEETILLAVN